MVPDRDKGVFFPWPPTLSISYFDWHNNIYKNTHEKKVSLPVILLSGYN